MKMSSLFVVVAGTMLLGACGLPEGEEAVETQELESSSTVACREYTAGGSTTSCKSTADWKNYATQTCASVGLQLTSFSVANACGPSTTSDSFATAKFTCCP